MKAAKSFCRIIVSLFFLLLLGTFLSHQPMSFNVFSAREEPLVVEAAETKVTTANLNMRTGPGTGYAIITVIPKGAQVSVSGYSGDWAEVSYSGKSGYAHSSYLKSVSDVRYTTANLNMRTGPGTSYQVILVIPKGAEVAVLDSSSSWYKVSYGGKTGYVSSTYLSGTQTAPAELPVRYTTANLNMRTGPGTSYQVIVVIPKGAAVSVIDSSSSWYKVSYGGKTGYVSSTYLSGTQTAPAELPVRYTTADLNLRTGPGTSYSIILTMPKGSKVSILDTKSAWPKVRYGTKEGYASPNYLSTTPPSTLPSTSPTGDPAIAISKGNESSSVKRIALTFDDYGSADQIRSILNSLENYGARGTFFPNGDFVKNNPALIREITSRGHSVESHTYAHKKLTDLSDEEVRNQIRLAQSAIYNATGRYPVLMRPPYGAYDSRIRTIAGQEGIRYLVLWSVDTSDWATTRDGVTITTDYVINTAVNNASQNGIILMHMHSNKTVSGLPTILSRLRDQGYHFVTVNEMVN